MKTKVAYGILIILTSMLLFSCRKKGCTNPNAINYNTNDKVGDGTCICNTDRSDYSPPTPYDLQILTLF